MAMLSLNLQERVRRSAVFPKLVDDMEVFMSTFDQEDTRCDGGWAGYAKQYKVEEHFPVDDIGLLICLWKLDPYINDKNNKADQIDFQYQLECLIYGSEEAYIESL